MLRKILPHIEIILSLLLLTLVILDKFNPGMNFAGSLFFKILLIMLCVASLFAAGFLLALDRRRK